MGSALRGTLRSVPPFSRTSSAHCVCTSCGVYAAAILESPLLTAAGMLSMGRMRYRVEVAPAMRIIYDRVARFFSLLYHVMIDSGMLTRSPTCTPACSAV